MLKDWLLLRLIPFLGWLFISLIGKTVRWKVRGEEHLKALKESGEHVIYAFWHNRLLLITYALRHRGIIVLVSSSRDGEYISRTIHKFGTGAIRGSTTSRGARALLQMTKKLKSGYDGAVTPDGPQGPKYKVQPGIVHLAQKTGLPIVPVTYGAGRKTILNSWDAFIVPHPFSRAVLVYGSPVEVPAKSSAEVREAKREELEQTLKVITQQADEYFKDETRKARHKVTNYKFEARSTKYETISNDRNTNDQNNV
ncbi:MAG: lysophospholipid acyltransferase family protein [Nitrospirae bacterium]|nr:lysophospholipid acyltransferase family protein [Nitrospirota bacterium]